MLVLKNHIQSNGKNLKTNKRWKDLTEKQKNHIFSIMQKGFSDGESKEVVFQSVLSYIKEFDIWLPEIELQKMFRSKLQKYQKKVVDECGKTSF